MQWFLSETIQGGFEEACPDLQICERVIHGGIALTPDYIGKSYPTSGSYPLRYQEYADRWHSQPTFLNSGDGKLIDGCDNTTDDFGKLIWQA